MTQDNSQQEHLNHASYFVEHLGVLSVEMNLRVMILVNEKQLRVMTEAVGNKTSDTMK